MPNWCKRKENHLFIVVYKLSMLYIQYNFIKFDPFFVLFASLHLRLWRRSSVIFWHQTFHCLIENNKRVPLAQFSSTIRRTVNKDVEQHLSPRNVNLTARKLNLPFCILILNYSQLNFSKPSLPFPTLSSLSC